MPKRVGDLEINQDPSFDAREFMVQRAGRAAMAVVVGAALLGYFGAGPLSLTEIRDSAGAFTVTYERFGRRGATTNLTLEIEGGIAQNGKLEVWVSSDYLGKMKIDGITPNPDQVAAADGGAVYTFLVDEEDDPVTINFNLTIDSMGRESGRIGLHNGDVLDFSQFFVP